MSRASSRRRTGSPKSLVGPARGASTPGPRGGGPARRTAWWSPGVVPHPGGGVPDRLLDVGVAGAPAEVAADELVDLLLGDLRARVPRLQARRDRHQEPRRAEAALQGVALAEGLLHRVEHLAALV